MFVSNIVSHSSLLNDLSQLGRVLTLRRPRLGSFSPNVDKLPWLVLLYCLISMALSIALNGRAGGAVALDGAMLAPFGAVAVVAGLLKWIDRRQDGGVIWLALTLLLLALPLAEFVSAIIQPLVSGSAFFAHARDTLPGFASWLAGMLPHFISALPHLWLALAGALFIARAGHGWQRGLYIPVTPLVLFIVFTSADPLAIWQTDTENFPATDSSGITIDEEVFYGQPRLLDEDLARIETGKPGVPEIFFLGIAGDEEGVFMREALAVERLFRERYATADRSIVLINNPTTVRKLPFASHESLSRALLRIGEQMNGEEDLLFLFLTSHGSDDHYFSIKLSPFEFSDLTPQMLRKALDDAGIERRVIVISACYSGGFIPELADENTLVITAASADRPSFGCNDTNDLTDFGRAYFDEALRETRSFTEAFERARAVIAAREAANGSFPSNPQMAGGESLRAQLEWFALNPAR